MRISVFLIKNDQFLEVAAGYIRKERNKEARINGIKPFTPIERFPNTESDNPPSFLDFR